VISNDETTFPLIGKYAKEEVPSMSRNIDL
jgi:hypothetical protein